MKYLILTFTIFSLGLLNAQSIIINEVSDFTVSKWIEGSSSYQVNGISVASTIETNNVITDLNTIYNCYCE